MGNYKVFLQKEIMEIFRTKRILGLFCVFVFFAVTSPLLARYMMEFIELLAPAEEQLGFIMADPVWTDSYIQLYGNLAQIGNIAIILLFMGAIVSEKRRSTADLVFTKGLCHSHFVMAKFTVMSAAVLAAMLVSVLITYAITATLFDTGGRFGEVLLGGFLYALFMVLIVSVTLLASTVAKSLVISAMLAFVGFLLIAGISALPTIGDLLPGQLLNRSVEVTAGYFHGNLLGNVLTTLGLGLGCLLLSIFLLKRQEGA